MAERTRRARRPSVLTATALVALGVISYTASTNFSAAATVVPPGVRDAELTVGDGRVTDPLVIPAPSEDSGAVVQRRVFLVIDSTTGRVGAITLTTSAEPGSGAVSEHTRLWVARCSRPWARSGPESRPSYSCPTAGKQSDVLGSADAPVPIGQEHAALARLDLADGSTNHLRVQLTTAPRAPAPAVGESPHVTFEFSSAPGA